MSRSPVINTLPIFGLLIVSTILSATREPLIVEREVEGQRHITRQAQVMEESYRRVQSHRLSRFLKEPLTPSDDQNVNETKNKNSSKLEKKDSNSTLGESEIKDMMETHVTPQDNDDDDRVNGTAMSTKKPLETIDEKSSEAKARNSTPDSNATTALPPPAIFPVDNTTANIRIVTPEWFAKLNMTSYMTNVTNANSTSGATTVVPVLVVTMSPASDAPTKVQSPVGDSTTTAPATTSITTTLEVTTDEATTTNAVPTPSSPSPAEMKLHEKKIPVPEKMPTGITALIAAISFAIVAIVVYIGILVRKRYFEWRYGNRELLVNDFDAADMSNFEL